MNTIMLSGKLYMDARFIEKNRKGNKDTTLYVDAKSPEEDLRDLHILRFFGEMAEKVKDLKMHDKVSIVGRQNNVINSKGSSTRFSYILVDDFYSEKTGRIFLTKEEELKNMTPRAREITIDHRNRENAMADIDMTDTHI